MAKKKSAQVDLMVINLAQKVWKVVLGQLFLCCYGDSWQYICWKASFVRKMHL